MEFEYLWKNREANFGPPIAREADGGTHITFDILLRNGTDYVALRRNCIPGHEIPDGSPPEGLLFLCHDLIRYGERVGQCVKRIVASQTGVKVNAYRVVDLRTVLMEESGGKKIRQWAIIPFVIADVDKIPERGTYGNEVREIVTFSRETVPEGFAFGKQEIIRRILDKE